MDTTALTQKVMTRTKTSHTVESEEVFIHSVFHLALPALDHPAQALSQLNHPPVVLPSRMIVSNYIE